MQTVLTFLCALTISSVAAAQEAKAPPAPRPARIEVTPARVEAEVGQTLKFSAAGLDEDGKRLDLKPTAWFATPFDSAAADQNGSATFFVPGEIKVGAVIGGKPGFATVIVKPPSVVRIDIEPVTAPIAVGAGVKLAAVPRTSNGDPRADADVEWTSDAPAVATIDAAGLVPRLAP